MRSLCERVLRDAGYTVLTAADGHEAVDMFEKHGEGIAMAVLDVVMPKAGGRAVYETLQKKRPGLRCLFSSGYSTSTVHTGFVSREGVDFIQKPYSPHALLRKVREILDTEKEHQGETA